MLYFTGLTLRVFQPYMGVAAAMKDVQIIDNSDFYFGFNTPAVLDLFGDLNPNQPTIPSLARLPSSSVGLSSAFMQLRSDIHPIVWRRAAGTARQVVDLVPADINLKPTYEKRAEWEEFGKRSWGLMVPLVEPK
jgi:hypothetical protein